MRGGAWLSSGVGGLEDVEDGEEEDPDDIYKVPIKTDIIERGGASRPIIAREELAEIAPQNQENADEHMRAVKARHHEEAGAINSMFVEPKSFMMEVIPLPCLHRKKNRPGYDRGKEPEETRFAFLLDGRFGVVKQKTAANQNERIRDHDQVQSGQGPLNPNVRRSGGRPGFAAREAENDVSTDQPGKQHRLRGQKRNHAESARFRRGLNVTGVFAVRQDSCAHNPDLNRAESDKFESFIVASNR